MGAEVLVIQRNDADFQLSKKKRIDSELVEFVCIDDEDVDARPFLPTSSSTVHADVELVPVVHLQSQLLLTNQLLKYQRAEEKLRKKLEQICLDDHLWFLKSWNANGVAIVKFIIKSASRILEVLPVTMGRR